jgi:hypothetical protein
MKAQAPQQPGAGAGQVRRRQVRRFMPRPQHRNLQPGDPQGALDEVLEQV